MAEKLNQNFHLVEKVSGKWFRGVKLILLFTKVDVFHQFFEPGRSTDEDFEGKMLSK